LYLTIETRSWHLGERAVNKGGNSNPVDFERIQNQQTKWGEKKPKQTKQEKPPKKSTKNDLPDLY
jgi:hypothetical protein